MLCCHSLLAAPQTQDRRRLRVSAALGAQTDPLPASSASGRALLHDNEPKIITEPLPGQEFVLLSTGPVANENGFRTGRNRDASGDSLTALRGARVDTSGADTVLEDGILIAADLASPIKSFSASLPDSNRNGRLLRPEEEPLVVADRDWHALSLPELLSSSGISVKPLIENNDSISPEVTKFTVDDVVEVETSTQAVVTSIQSLLEADDANDENIIGAESAVSSRTIIKNVNGTDFEYEYIYYYEDELPEDEPSLFNTFDEIATTTTTAATTTTTTTTTTTPKPSRLSRPSKTDGKNKKTSKLSNDVPVASKHRLASSSRSSKHHQEEEEEDDLPTARQMTSEIADLKPIPIPISEIKGLMELLQIESREDEKSTRFPPRVHSNSRKQEDSKKVRVIDSDSFRSATTESSSAAGKQIGRLTILSGPGFTTEDLTGSDEEVEPEPEPEAEPEPEPEPEPQPDVADHSSLRDLVAFSTAAQEPQSEESSSSSSEEEEVETVTELTREQVQVGLDKDQQVINDDQAVLREQQEALNAKQTNLNFQQAQLNKNQAEMIQRQQDLIILQQNLTQELRDHQSDRELHAQIVEEQIELELEQRDIAEAQEGLVTIQQQIVQQQTEINAEQDGINRKQDAINSQQNEFNKNQEKFLRAGKAVEAVEVVEVVEVVEEDPSIQTEDPLDEIRRYLEEQKRIAEAELLEESTEFFRGDELQIEEVKSEDSADDSSSAPPAFNLEKLFDLIDSGEEEEEKEVFTTETPVDDVTVIPDLSKLFVVDAEEMSTTEEFTTEEVTTPTPTTTTSTTTTTEATTTPTTTRPRGGARFSSSSSSSSSRGRTNLRNRISSKSSQKETTEESTSTTARSPTTPPRRRGSFSSSRFRPTSKRPTLAAAKKSKDAEDEEAVDVVATTTTRRPGSRNRFETRARPNFLRGRTPSTESTPPSDDAAAGAAEVVAAPDKTVPKRPGAVPSRNRFQSSNRLSLADRRNRFSTSKTTTEEPEIVDIPSTTESVLVDATVEVAGSTEATIEDSVRIEEAAAVADVDADADANADADIDDAKKSEAEEEDAEDEGTTTSARPSILASLRANRKPGQVVQRRG